MELFFKNKYNENQLMRLVIPDSVDDLILFGFQKL